MYKHLFQFEHVWDTCILHKCSTLWNFKNFCASSVIVDTCKHVHNKNKLRTILKLFNLTLHIFIFPQVKNFKKKKQQFITTLKCKDKKFYYINMLEYTTCTWHMSCE